MNPIFQIFKNKGNLYMIYNLIFQQLLMKKIEDEEAETQTLKAKYKIAKDVESIYYKNVQPIVSSIKKVEEQLKDGNIKKLFCSNRIEGGQTSQMIINTILNKKVRNNEQLNFPPSIKAMIVPKKKGKRKGNIDYTSEMDVLMDVQTQVIQLLEEMERIYNKDLQAFQNLKMAIRKISFLNKFAKKILNMTFRSIFIEQGGLDVLGEWLKPINHQLYGQIQPSCTLKTGILTIVRDMNLSSEQINKSSKLFGLIEKNKYSNSKNIRILSCSICQQYTFRMIEAEIQGRQQS